MRDVSTATGPAVSHQGTLEDEPSSGDAGTAPSAAGRRPRPLSPEQRRQRRRLEVVGVVIVAAIGFLVFKGLTSAIVFFKTANEAVAQRATLGNSTFQLEGMVLPGTVRTLRESYLRQLFQQFFNYDAGSLLAYILWALADFSADIF